MKLTIFQVKLIHTLIFAVLSGCVLYVLYSGLFNVTNVWTWLAVAAILIEGVVLLANNGNCPLTDVAERLGAGNGSVADIFLPKWFADRLFPICGTIFLIGLAALVLRLLNQ